MILSYAWWITITIVPAVILVGLGMQPNFLRVMAITLIFYLAAAYARHQGLVVQQNWASACYLVVIPQGLIGLFVTVWRGFTYYLNLAIGGLLMAAGIARSNSLPIEEQPTEAEKPFPKQIPEITHTERTKSNKASHPPVS